LSGKINDRIVCSRYLAVGLARGEVAEVSVREDHHNVGLDASGDTERDRGAVLEVEGPLLLLAVLGLELDDEDGLGLADNVLLFGVRELADAIGDLLEEGGGRETGNGDRLLHDNLATGGVVCAMCV